MFSVEVSSLNDEPNVSLSPWHTTETLLKGILVLIESSVLPFFIEICMKTWNCSEFQCSKGRLESPSKEERRVPSQKDYFPSKGLAREKMREKRCSIVIHWREAQRLFNHTQHKRGEQNIIDWRIFFSKASGFQSVQLLTGKGLVCLGLVQELVGRSVNCWTWRWGVD